MTCVATPTAASRGGRRADACCICHRVDGDVSQRSFLLQRSSRCRVGCAQRRARRGATGHKPRGPTRRRRITHATRSRRDAEAAAKKPTLVDPVSITTSFLARNNRQLNCTTGEDTGRRCSLTDSVVCTTRLRLSRLAKSRLQMCVGTPNNGSQRSVSFRRAG